MGTSATTDQNALSEQSLLRSLSSIHRRSPACVTSNSLHHRPSSPVIWPKSILRRRNRYSNDSYPRNSATMPPFAKGFSELPFSKDGSISRDHSNAKDFQRRHSPIMVETVTRRTNKKQRQRCLTNDTESTLVMDVDVSKKQSSANQQRQREQLRRHLTNAELTENNDSPRQERSNVASDAHQIRGYRSDYSLGDTLRSPSHMIIEPNPEQAIQAVESLKMHDFAFVKRSNGSYSFAILAYRSMEPTKRTHGGAAMGECMNFVIGDSGSTKMVRRSHWSRSICLVSMEGLDGCHQVNDTPATAVVDHFTSKACTPPALSNQYIKEQNIQPECIVDLIPPNMIAFVPQMMNEECSIMSSVSGRAMGL
mmetsp:Transcript_26701/g.57452  ORF Transcript_26701/g.57452 Transcript_26701/m.57452 type:complete len:366 (+) Transcript_26701:61-1158(+)